ncbi:transcriptional regulator, TetR family [Anaeromyxobacter sp. K]|uniref:TetR/AcrR family transcriptional regulator n=1 Tax=Anaeromyxobacter sp. (strain K) TaxID=447217 RepID=UPI00015F8A41|nr:helix-turn-helix domain-containing protein [Anaeromyxobacter sp. K]ACG74230.1 transcriptional regulator, TetR family [Anaeromyxobacter sp. K]
MAQRLKEDVRARLVDAALSEFVRRGWRGARLVDIAVAAGASIGNVYRYFPDKEALLRAAVPPELGTELVRLLRARVRALGAMGDWRLGDAAGSDRAAALLAFWIAHRREVVVLLGRAEGSPVAHVRPLVAGELTRAAARYLRDHSERPVPREVRFVLERIFEGTLGMIVDVLAAHETPEEISAAFGAFWRYQLAGLQALLAPPRPVRGAGGRARR